MKIKLKNDAILGGTSIKFHKGKVYNAIVATNQPNWLKDEKVFAQKSNGDSILLYKEDYVIVDEFPANTFLFHARAKLANW